LHQLGSASDVGFQIESDRIPIDESVATVAADEEERLAMATTFGEDFELVATVPPGAVATLADRVDCQFSVVGEVRPSADGIRIDEEPLPNRGWTHGG
jgi:thiamine-monophosphate kinase